MSDTSLLEVAVTTTFADRVPRPWVQEVYRSLFWLRLALATSSGSGVALPTVLLVSSDPPSDISAQFAKRPKFHPRCQPSSVGRGGTWQTLCLLRSTLPESLDTGARSSNDEAAGSNPVKCTTQSKFQPRTGVLLFSPLLRRPQLVAVTVGWPSSARPSTSSCTVAGSARPIRAAISRNGL